MDAVPLDVKRTTVSCRADASSHDSDVVSGDGAFVCWAGKCEQRCNWSCFQGTLTSLQLLRCVHTPCCMHCTVVAWHAVAIRVHVYRRLTATR